jgi:hypothetical protein
MLPLCSARPQPRMEPETQRARMTQQITDAAAEAVVPEAYDLKLTVAGEDGPSRNRDRHGAARPCNARVQGRGPDQRAGAESHRARPQGSGAPDQQQNDAFAETRTAMGQAGAGRSRDRRQELEVDRPAFRPRARSFRRPGVDDKGNKNEFRQLLDDTGLGNHPAMIRFCRKVGEGLAEDGTLARGSEGPRAKPEGSKRCTRTT